MATIETTYTLHGTTALAHEEAVERTREELGAEGFGVLSEIDVRATLRAKLGVETEPYLILGACNPPAAHRALSAEPDLGALLPCNVAVYERDGRTHVAAVDPRALLGLVGNPALDPVADEIRARLERAVAAVWAA